MAYLENRPSRFRLLFLWALVLLSGVSMGRSIDLVPLSRALETPDDIGPEQALEQFATSAGLIQGNTTFGFSQNYFWILIDLPAEANTEKQYFLDVDNPHIDNIRAYLVSVDTVMLLGQSGDRMPFAARTYKNRSNVFPVHFKTPEDQLLLFVDKRNASVFVPIVLWESAEFLQYDVGLYMTYGFYFGMLLIIMLYSLLIYLTQRAPIYLWYLIYVVSLFLYTFTYVGFGFQYLFPEQFQWNNYSRLILIVVIVISQIKFTQLFLPIRSIQKWVNRGFQLVMLSLALILAWWIIVPGLYTAYTILVINSIYALVGVTLVLITVALVLSWEV